MTKHDAKSLNTQAAVKLPASLEWFEAYYQPANRQKVELRALTPLEQMFAYYEA